jgi:integrase
MAMLSTHARAEAVLECDLDTQLIGGRLHFLRPQEEQTKKRRSIVPVAPTLARWLDGRTGKLIQYRTYAIDRVTGATVAVTRPTRSIKTSFEQTLIAAGIVKASPDVKMEGPEASPGSGGGEKPQFGPSGLGSPNTLRHTHSTEMHRRGVPEAQIDTAAGHSGESTNKKNYRHLRPEYLRDWIDAVEDYWSGLDALTKAHRREHRPASVHDLAPASKGSRS